ncbi:SpoIIE family protein phosphatase [Streptomyces sp. NRRL F-4489]|uniref:SpoIIE family protein phosphatase n=1 Tax=Streptomyces sp. NRRL F-4489 TaxID=1609095 RepID=UPI001F2F0AB3|nr:SpoIIE family protein phosphatase [Streptomyces sp. NRRL F-4489]
MRIDHYSAVHLAAETARTLAARCGLPGALPDRAAVVASELAGNLAKHAVSGSLYVQPMPLGGGLEVLAADRGPGMPEIRRCLADGYSTTGSLGAGLGAVDRIAAYFAIRTEIPGGTLACARIAPPDRADAAREAVGAVCVPAERETANGDGYAVLDTGGSRTVFVVDGLGHGEPAAEAAQAALRAFARAADQPLPDVLRTVHRALRHTRGAAAGLLRHHPDRVEFAAVGNIRCVALTAHEVRRRLAGQPGIVGLNLPAPQVRCLPREPGLSVLLHSDGIDPAWTRSTSPFLLRLPAPLLAAALADRHRLIRDDATVVVAGPHQGLT